MNETELEARYKDAMKREDYLETKKIKEMLDKNNECKTDIINHPETITITLGQEDIQRLHDKVNNGDRYHIKLNTHQYVDRIIELWFEEHEYDFWDNPYPEVIEMSYTKESGELTFTYLNK